MATTRQHAVYDQPLDASQAFERYVETNPGVCNACYRRVEADDTDGTNVENKGWVGERTTRHEDDGRVTGTEPDRDHSARYHWEGWDVCPHCGQLGLSSPDTTLSADAAVDRALRLSQRLDERGIAHDWLTLVRFVQIAKSKPKYAGKDREIAAKAAKVAIEEAHQ